MPTHATSKALPIWKIELANDFDNNFILDGLKHGFPLGDVDAATIEHTSSNNHTSANNIQEKVDFRLREEMEDANYMKIEEGEATLISPLAANEKSDGDVRFIHDLSLPKDRSLNDYAAKDKCIYSCLEDALQTLQPG